MAGDLHELSVAIGRLQEGQERVNESLREIREASTEEHRKVHDIVVAMSETVRNLAATVKEMKPLTDDYREKRAEARGAAKLVKVIYATSGGLIAATAMKVFEYFGGRMPPSPPHP